jgi:hypothetical protein
MELKSFEMDDTLKLRQPLSLAVDYQAQEHQRLKKKKQLGQCK